MVKAEGSWIATPGEELYVGMTGESPSVEVVVVETEREGLESGGKEGDEIVESIGVTEDDLAWIGKV